MLNFLRLASVAVVLALATAACQSLTKNGPGMIVTYTSLINGRSISAKSVTLPDGMNLGNPGSIGGIRSKNWRSGSTLGASGDHRGLPEWVDFEWQEPPYPGLHPENFANRESFGMAVDKLFKSLPVKTQRVQVRDRVPLDVVQEVIEARNKTPGGKLPDKLLWVYFVWTDNGIKFHWSLKGDTQIAPLREGGDDIDAM